MRLHRRERDGADLCEPVCDEINDARNGTLGLHGDHHVEGDSDSCVDERVDASKAIAKRAGTAHELVVGVRIVPEQRYEGRRQTGGHELGCVARIDLYGVRLELDELHPQGARSLDRADEPCPSQCRLPSRDGHRPLS